MRLSLVYILSFVCGILASLLFKGIFFPNVLVGQILAVILLSIYGYFLMKKKIKKAVIFLIAGIFISIFVK